MTELFGCERGDDRQGLLFDRSMAWDRAAVAEVDAKRRSGETAVDYRIRRQYRDVTATAPLFPTRGRARR
jgi:hypothetical protein